MATKWLGAVPGLAVVLGLVVGCGAGGSSDVDLTSGDAAAGQRAFGTYCAACHGEGGGGTPSGPPLVGPEARDLTAQQIVDAVREGADTDQWAGSAMPALPAVSDEELADVVAHVRQLRGEPLDASSP